MGCNLTPKALCCGHQLNLFSFKYFYLISERIQLFHHFGMPLGFKTEITFKPQPQVQL